MEKRIRPMKPGHRVGVLVCAVLVLSLVGPSGCVPKIGFAPTPDPVTLRFAYRQHTAKLQSLFDAYHEKRPWVTIEPIEVRRWGNEIDLRLKTGAVDIFRDTREALRYVADGLLMPLDDIQLGDWSAIRDDYYKGAWEGLSILGQQWGIPAGLDMLVIYVNMDQARALKVDIPDANWSLFDLVELATKLSYPEGLPHSEGGRLFGFCTTPDGFDPIVFIYLHGGKIVDNINAPTMPTLDNLRTIEAVQWYSDLFNQFGVAPDPEIIRTTFRRGGIYEAAIRGACGAWMGWYGGRGGADIGQRWRADWAMLPLPRGRAVTGLGDVEGYFITKDCAQPKEALKLLRFLSDHYEGAGHRLPPRRSMVDAKEYEDAVGEEIAAIARTFSDKILMIPAQNSQALERVGAELIAAIKEIVAEDLNAGDVLPETQQKVRTVFETP